MCAWLLFSSWATSSKGYTAAACTAGYGSAVVTLAR